ncbi:MAG: hypothetical protein ABUL49_01790 [bacterium]
MRRILSLLALATPIVSQANVRIEILAWVPDGLEITSSQGDVWAGYALDPSKKRCPITGVGPIWRYMDTVKTRFMVTLHDSTAKIAVGEAGDKGGIWNLATGSLTTLSDRSVAWGATDTYQVGWSMDKPFGLATAGAWQGTAASHFDLDKGGFTQTWAYAVCGNQAGGQGMVGNDGPGHALYWKSLKGKPIDLNPTGSAASGIMGMDETRQGGAAFGHPGFWRGTASSFVDLMPPKVLSGQVNGFKDEYEFGTVEYPKTHTRVPAIWKGTAASFVDLNSYLPKGFVPFSARAGGVTTVDGKHVVYGVAGAGREWYLIRWHLD